MKRILIPPVVEGEAFGPAQALTHAPTLATIESGKIDSTVCLFPGSHGSRSDHMLKVALNFRLSCLS